jgi:hypothetical protein
VPTTSPARPTKVFGSLRSNFIASYAWALLQKLGSIPPDTGNGLFAS